MKHQSLRIFGIIVVCVCRLVFAQNQGANPLTATGWGWLSMGKVVSSQKDTSDAYDYDFTGEVLSDVSAGLKIAKQISPNWRGRLNIGVGYLFTAYDAHKTNAEFLAKRGAILLGDATIEGYFSPNNADSMRLEIGYFPVRYTRQAQNFGEYLFRSGTYPAYVLSGFEIADKVKMGGVHLSYAVNRRVTLKEDLYANTELDVYPLHDISFSSITTFSPHHSFEIGAGVSYAHAISLDNRKTTPGTDTVVFNPHYGGDIRWTGHIDTLTGDTTFYTFSGVKAMARFGFDPKMFFPSVTIFGKEDLKLYAEAALLGAENYPGWYTNRFERMPVMAGFIIPTFKIFDIFAIEGEWYGSKYWNSLEYIWKTRSPVPYSGNPNDPNFANWTPRTDDDWKWSIYCSRMFLKTIRISGQVASDHSMRNAYMPGPPSFAKYTEICPRTKDWYWMTRVSFYF